MALAVAAAAASASALALAAASALALAAASASALALASASALALASAAFFFSKSSYAPWILLVWEQFCFTSLISNWSAVILDIFWEQHWKISHHSITASWDLFRF